MKPLFKAPVASLLLTLAAASAHGQVILSDTLTGTNGTSITGHAPNVNLAGTTYVAGSGFNAPSPSFTTTAFSSTPTSLALDGDAYAEVGIGSNGTYTRPTGGVTLSANLEIGGISQGAANNARGLFLGFVGTQTSGTVAGGTAIDSGGTFAGLIFSPVGSLFLETPGATTAQTPVGTYNAALLGTFNANSFYSLSYSLNLTTGILSNITLSNATGTETFTAPSSNIFAGTTTIAPNNLAVFASSSAFTTGFVDDLSLTAVPEPSTWAMLLCGAGGLAWLARRHRQAA